MKIEDSKSGGYALAKRTLPFVRPYRVGVLGAIFLTVLTSSMDAAEPLLMKVLFDSFAVKHLNMLLGAAGGLIALGMSRQAIGGLLSVIMWYVHMGVNVNIQKAVVERLYSLPLSFFRNENAGGIITKMNQSIAGYLAALSEITTKVLPNILYLLFSLISMCVLDWRLFLLALVFAPLPSLIGVWASTEQTQREKKLLVRWAQVYSRFYEALSGIAVVKSFAKEHEEMLNFIGRVRDTNRIVMKGVIRDNTIGSTNNLIVTFSRVLVAAVGGYMVIQGKTTVGTVVAFISYMGGLYGPVQGLTGTYQILRKASVFLKSIFGILDAPDPLKDEPDAIAISKIRGEIQFSNVSFSYNGTQPVLSDISFHVHPGETIGLIGPSGSGKTTIISLLQRFENPVSGEILVDGINVKSLRIGSLRSQIGFVLQDNILFNTTIRDNIAYGRPDASTEEIEKVAVAANAHDFIMSLPKGYDTLVGEGGKCFSMGQRQRIAIARALLKDPPIIILDEATSALDIECESLVQEALNRLMQGRTVIVIAHRLQTVVNANRIMVLREGRIVEAGSHSELITADSYYASLIKKQNGGWQQSETSPIQLDKMPVTQMPVDISVCN
ncbi:MAG: ABC transporter ATP-binding protein [Candidatus Abyssobacteria bacterium SURF_5]|uniref:ABC transporter ATP-binding protein n=1 Tax=Abyssobacteria bacterium (strain SURF_5) TaxID=2093360 RepID=A0A3A4P620_ABYX5|nr:MAG: ABC transporter ATP-binding protein [Candidatus Abyssubacteria bacterium SURF_5]